MTGFYFPLRRGLFLVLWLVGGAGCSKDSGAGATLGGLPDCGTGQTECNGICVNAQTHPEHCGACGVRCASGAVCVEGECVESCEDPLSDPENCGACGVRCDEGQTCNAGTCTCPGGQEWCDGGCVPAGDCDNSGGAGGEGGSPPSTSNTSTSQGGGGATAGMTTSTTGTGDCVISVEADLSSAIATVGIVTFSATGISIDEAYIEFARAGGGPTYVAPVDLNEPDYRTLLLGMKGDTEYEYRIVLNDGECSSPTRTITTGPVSNSVPALTKDTPLPEAVAPGFIITSSGIGGLGSGDSPAYIIDSEGDVVWWSPAPASCSRAKMDWEGTHMYMMALNVRYNVSAGNVRRVSMDGLSVEDKLSGLSGGHHDFTVTPGGNIVAIVHRDSCSGIVERTPAGELMTIVSDVHDLYEPVGDCHPNSIHYHPDDASFTISDRNPDLFVKISRTGELQWQLGGLNPVASTHFEGTWAVNHGHHLLPNGNFLFFNNGAAGGASPVLEVTLTEPEASLVWSYTSDHTSPTLGDVQRLPNGNTLITYSNQGVIQEVNSAKELVQEFKTGSIGYVEHRSTLYGAPPR